MLPQRVAVSIVGIPVIVALTLLGSPLFTIVAGFLLTVAALEFYAATDPTSGGSQTPHLLRQRPLALLGAASVALLVAAADNGSDWWTRALALLVLLPFLPIILRGERDGHCEGREQH